MAEKSESNLFQRKCNKVHLLHDPLQLSALLTSHIVFYHPRPKFHQTDFITALWSISDRHDISILKKITSLYKILKRNEKCKFCIEIILVLIIQEY